MRTLFVLDSDNVFLHLRVTVRLHRVVVHTSVYTEEGLGSGLWDTPALIWNIRFETVSNTPDVERRGLGRQHGLPLLLVRG